MFPFPAVVRVGVDVSGGGVGVDVAVSGGVGVVFLDSVISGGCVVLLVGVCPTSFSNKALKTHLIHGRETLLRHTTSTAAKLNAHHVRDRESPATKKPIKRLRHIRTHGCKKFKANRSQKFK